jgi:putative hydrolase of the HAD superfamily
MNNKQFRIPKAVIFDTDNTLYAYDPAHDAAIKSVIEKAISIFGVGEVEFMHAFEISRADVKRILGNTASSHSRLLYFQKTIEYLGMGTRILTTLDLEQTYWRTFLANTRLFPDVFNFLQQLKDKNIKTANITDLTAQIQFRKMVYFGLDEYFNYVVTSEESGHDKPNVRSFNIALEKLGVLAQDAWMVGDSFESDMVGAHQANIIKVHKIHKGQDANVEKNEAVKPDIVFREYRELIKYFSN